MRYVGGVDEAGRPIKVSDPLAGDFAASRPPSRRSGRICAGLLGIRAVFGDDLHNEPRFAVPVTRWLTNLFADGAAKTCGQGDRPLMITLACDDEAHELAPAFAHDLAT